MKSHSDLNIDQYNADVNKLTRELNDVSKLYSNQKQVIEKQKNLIAQLRKLDANYIKSVLQAQDHSVKTILFTRHGHCSDTKKKFGLNPNAAIRKKAKIAMTVTENLTSEFFEEAEKTKIFISPMLRALQTASLIIPTEFKGDIEVTANITEKSDMPSGKDMRTREDLKSLGIMGRISDILYGDRIDSFVQPERTKAINILNKKAGKIISDTLPQALSDDEKVKNIQKSIASTLPGHAQWNICHGKISQKFLKDTLGYETSFDFGETKKILYYKGQNGEDAVFIPPYSLVINQETGMIESRLEVDKKLSIGAFFKRHPIFTGVLIGMGIAALAVAIAAALLLSGGIAAAPIVGVAAAVGAAITGGVVTGALAVAIGFTLTGLSLAATGAAVGAVGGTLVEISNESHGGSVSMFPNTHFRVQKKLFNIKNDELNAHEIKYKKESDTSRNQDKACCSSGAFFAPGEQRQHEAVSPPAPAQKTYPGYIG